MNNDHLKSLNADELVLMEKLKDILISNEFNYSITTHQYVQIKLNGYASLGDVLQFEMLSIPIFDLIAAIREQDVTTVMDNINNRSVTFYEIRKALDMFVDSCWNP